MGIGTATNSPKALPPFSPQGERVNVMTGLYDGSSGLI